MVPPEAVKYKGDNKSERQNLAHFSLSIFEKKTKTDSLEKKNYVTKIVLHALKMAIEMNTESSAFNPNPIGSSIIFYTIMPS